MSNQRNMRAGHDWPVKSSTSKGRSTPSPSEAGTGDGWGGWGGNGNGGVPERSTYIRYSFLPRHEGREIASFHPDHTSGPRSGNPARTASRRPNNQPF